MLLYCTEVGKTNVFRCTSSSLFGCTDLHFLKLNIIIIIIIVGALRRHRSLTHIYAHLLTHCFFCQIFMSAQELFQPSGVHQSLRQSEIRKRCYRSAIITFETHILVSLRPIFFLLPKCIQHTLIKTYTHAHIHTPTQKPLGTYIHLVLLKHTPNLYKRNYLHTLLFIQLLCTV